MVGRRRAYDSAADYYNRGVLREPGRRSWRARTAQRGETCFLVIDDDKVTYNEFETKIALSRKSIPAQARPSKVTLREREVTEAEEEEREEEFHLEDTHLETHC